MRRTVHSDSAWNLVRGAAYSVLVSGPPIAAVWLDVGDWYAAWVVGFSFIPWVSLSALGIQPALLAIVGQHYEAEASETRVGAILVQATRILGRNVLIGSSMAAVVVAAAHLLGIAESSIGALGATPVVLVVLLLLAVAQLTNSTANAYLLAVDRARQAAALTAFGGLAVAVGVLVLKATDHDVGPVPFTLMIAVGHVPPIAVLALHFSRARRISRGSGHTQFTAGVRSQVSGFVRTHAVWVAPGVLVAGLDTTLVAEFDIDALRPYTVALAAAALLNGGMGAITSPYVPRLARTSNPWASRRPTPAVLAVIVPTSVVLLFGVHSSAFRTFAGPHEAAILLLGVAVLVRLLTVPQSIQAIAARRQKLLYPSSIGEALVNVVSSFTLGSAYGATGVAVGTLLGAWWAVAAHGRTRARVLGAGVPDATWVATVLLPALTITLAGLGQVAIWRGLT